MLEFIISFYTLCISIHTKQKINELEIPLFMQCQWTFSNIRISAALSGCPVVTSDRTHTGIRRTVSLHPEHVYKDNFWVEMSIKMNYCAIF